MSRNNNEKGYALLVVLFLIVFIMTASAILMNGSLSHAKQENIVDTNHLTVVSAEAGIELLKSTLNNEYYSREKELDELAKTRIKNMEKNKKVDYLEVQKELTNKLEEMLTVRIENDFKNKVIDFKNQYTFRLVDYQVKPRLNPGHIVITGSIKSENILNQKTQTLNFTHNFYVPSYDPNYISSDDNSLSNVNMHKLYPNNVIQPSCPKKSELDDVKCIALSNGNYKDIEDSTVYFPEGFKKENGNLDIEDSIVYAKGNFNVFNFNDLEDSEFYLDGNFEAKNMNEVEDSKIFINGSATINSNIELEESTFMVRGSLHIKGKLEVTDESLVCVAGSMQVDKKFSIEKGSAVYIWGSLANYDDKKINGVLKIMNSEQELWDKCKLGGSSDGEVIWTKPTITNVEYVK